VEGYDLLIYVANFPERRAYAWQQLLIARAIENQAYTIGVNCVGVDGKENTYSGDSALHDFEGQTIYRITHAEDVFTTTLSASAQQIFRQKLAFLNDQDAFSIR
jgi:predicted amidohydrolase